MNALSLFTPGQSPLYSSLALLNRLSSGYLNVQPACFSGHLYYATTCIMWPWIYFLFSVYFILIKQVFSDHLSYLTMFPWEVTLDRFDCMIFCRKFLPSLNGFGVPSAFSSTSGQPHRGIFIVLIVASSNFPVTGRLLNFWKPLQNK